MVLEFAPCSRCRLRGEGRDRDGLEPVAKVEGRARRSRSRGCGMDGPAFSPESWNHAVDSVYMRVYSVHIEYIHF